MSEAVQRFVRAAGDRGDRVRHVQPGRASRGI